MGFFKKLFGKQKDVNNPDETLPVFYIDSSTDVMQSAYKMARETFKYFWRELSWGV